MTITEALESSPSARDKLTLLYKQHKWLHIKEKPEESQLVTLALERIRQDPCQFDLFIDMLSDTEGMDLIMTTLTGGELCDVCIHYPPLINSCIPCFSGPGHPRTTKTWDIIMYSAKHIEENPKMFLVVLDILGLLRPGT